MPLTSFSYAFEKNQINENSFQNPQQKQINPITTSEQLTRYIDSLKKQLKKTDDVQNTINENIDDAVYYLEEFNPKKALKSSLIAYSIARAENKEELEINPLLLIAQINLEWGNEHISKSIYKKINQYELNLNDSLKTNLNLILQLGISQTYLKLNKADSSLFVINQIFNNHKNPKKTTIYNDFLWNYGVALVKNQDFEKGLDSLEKVVNLNPTLYHQALFNYYKATYFESINNEEKALQHYLAFDSLTENQRELFPVAKDVYSYINDYFLKKGDSERQFEYLTKFLNTLRIQTDISNYVVEKTKEFYEIPLLILEKQNEIERLKNQETKNQRRSILIALALLLIIVFSVFYILSQRKYKRRFEKLTQKKLESKEEEEKKIQNQTISIEVIDYLMKKLDDFEKSKSFLSSDVSLNSVSKDFQTNSTYLSKVVNLKKDKNFSNYINDLRVEYCITQLDKESKLRKYTIKALAAEMGFNNVQSFSTAFFKYTGIYPSFFIEQLKKTKKE